MKWINPVKKNFHCLADLDLETFLAMFEVVVWGGGVKNHTWTKSAGNFMKWINLLKKFFSLFGQSGLRSSGDQNEGWQPFPTTNLNPYLHVFVISYPMFFKPLQQGSISWGIQNEGWQPYTNYKSQYFVSYLCHIICSILQTYTISLNFIRWSKWGVTTLY